MTTRITISDPAIRDRVIEHIRALSMDKVWIIEIKRHTKNRSLSQLGLYWKWIGIIADETGNDKDGLHDIFKAKYLDPDMVMLGNVQHAVYTTTKLPVDVMSAYMSKVQAFAGSELGILLPIPEEQHR